MTGNSLQHLFMVMTGEGFIIGLPTVDVIKQWGHYGVKTICQLVQELFQPEYDIVCYYRYI